MNNDKRRFQRIPFDAVALVDIDNEPAISGVLQDISLKGALIAVDKTANMPAEQSICKITITPEQSDFAIELTAQVAYIHPDSGTFGVNILTLEVDSASHLRRLVEVNLRDEGALQRELSNLINAQETE